jgi:hypothetical protein
MLLFWYVSMLDVGFADLPSYLRPLNTLLSASLDLSASLARMRSRILSRMWSGKVWIGLTRRRS